MSKLYKQITNECKAKLAAARLTRSESEALALKLFDGFNSAEIASRLNIKQRTAQRLIRLACKKLKATDVPIPENLNARRQITYTNIEPEDWAEIAAPKLIARDIGPINLPVAENGGSSHRLTQNRIKTLAE